MTLLIAVGLFFVGALLSAFFSGNETGLYRATRVRLVLDTRDGSIVARGLLWLINNPSLFVATTLTGNNLANYLTSLAIVLVVGNLFGGHAHGAELVATLAMTPLLFVYCELLPKQLFYMAPNRLLVRGGPFFLLFTILFAPFSGVLWLMARGLQQILGESPERVQSSLARAELANVLREGHAAGVLEPIQHRLALALFEIANKPIGQFCSPTLRMLTIRPGTPKSDVLQLARRYDIAAVPVETVVGHERRLTGYIRIVDLLLDPRSVIEEDLARELPEISSRQTHLSAMLELQRTGQSMARVIDEYGHTVGLVAERNLNEPLFGNE